MYRYLLTIALLSTGCSTVPRPGDNPEALQRLACSPGANVTRIQGSVWIKARSMDKKGQFPAQVIADSVSGTHLKMEVTNLVGGTEALITVDGDSITVQTPDGSKQTDQGSWGGIPLRWAGELFMGRIPCPGEGARWMRSGDGVVAEWGSERFEYGFRSWGGMLWPEKLAWTQSSGSGPTSRVDFKFDDPEDKTNSPRKWQASSSQGQVDVRWKDRKVTAK